jgi:hypothetical protein
MVRRRGMTNDTPQVPRRHAAVHIRAALKAAFPSARFLVKSHKNWGCDVYAIRWTGEPSEGEVQALADTLASAKVFIHCEHNEAQA